MALGTQDIAGIETVLATTAEPARVIGDLRARFPRLAITRCDQSDIDLETPFRASGQVSIYLVDGSDHCWRLTGDAARATGLVVVTQRGA